MPNAIILPYLLVFNWFPKISLTQLLFPGVSGYSFLDRLFPSESFPEDRQP